MHWDPDHYGRFADERGRAFLDLLARVDATDPRRVVDLGCGPGTTTRWLADRWPDATVEGVDSSPAMIERAAAGPRLSFSVGTVEDWRPRADTDVVVSNATLHWVPGHRDLLRRWAELLPGDGWLAMAVPGNHAAPSHTLLRELAGEPLWADDLDGVLAGEDAVDTPEGYARLLADAGLTVDVWETTYLHRLTGSDPVLAWLRGTTLRPVLAALDTPRAADFERILATRLAAAYPAAPRGTWFPFRRIFAVGHRDPGR